MLRPLRFRLHGTSSLHKGLFGCDHVSFFQFKEKHFFFLHCRTSARHCRSTTGKSEDRKQFSPKAKANKNKHTNKATPTKPNQERSGEICKKGETGETFASLSSPSQVLFRQVVLPHIVHVRCLPYQWLHQETQASLEHLADVAV